MESKFLRSYDYDKLLKEVKQEHENPFGYFNEIYLQNKERNPDFLKLCLNAILRRESELMADWIGVMNLNPQFNYEDIIKHNPEYSFCQDLKHWILETEQPEQEKEIPATNPEAKGQPIQKPKGKPTLTREQTAILFYYLREKCLTAQPLNKDIAKAIQLISGYQQKQIEDILRRPETPVYQLGKDGKGIKRNDLKTVKSQLENIISKIDSDLSKYENELN
jgi:hypothetical protein